MSAAGVIRIAVVGVGHLGRHHARILGAMPGVQVVGILDLNGERAREVASASGTAVLTDLAQLPGTVDAVTIAVPTESHLAVALPLIESNGTTWPRVTILDPAVGSGAFLLAWVLWGEEKETSMVRAAPVPETPTEG